MKKLAVIICLVSLLSCSTALAISSNSTTPVPGNWDTPKP